MLRANEWLLVLLSGGLILASLPLLWQALRLSWREWSHPPDRWARLLAGALLAGALLRWLFAPHLIYTILIGYRWTYQCLKLFPIGHYGPASQTFYHLMLWVLPNHHRSLMATNAVLGVLVLPLAATWALRLLGSRRVAATYGLVLAVLPMMVRNDTSDSNNPPLLLWLFACLLLWDEYLRHGGWRRLIGPGVLLLLCMLGRPEWVLFAPLCVLLHTWAAGRLAEVYSRGQWRWLLAGLVLGNLPRLLHLWLALGELAGRQGVHLDLFPYLIRLVDLRCYALISPLVFPPTLLLPAIWLLWRARASRQRPYLALVAAALVGSYMVLPDLDYANFTRVHVPAAFFMALLGVAGWWRLWEEDASRLSGAHHRVFLLAALAMSFLLTWWHLYQPANEHEEERLVAEAIALLPKEQPFTLIVQTYADRRALTPDATPLNVHFPRYEVEPPLRQGRYLGVMQALEAPALWERGPVYYYQSVICYADQRHPFQPAPHGENLQPACRLMHERFRLEALLVREVPNYGDVWIDYYGDAPTLTIGLYRVLP